jgi:hypothetical protein
MRHFTFDFISGIFNKKSLICHVTHQSDANTSSTHSSRINFCFVSFSVIVEGLGTDFQEITTNIVLLGDHKQLGPVISSDIAARLGLGEKCASAFRSVNSILKSFFFCVVVNR